MHGCLAANQVLLEALAQAKLPAGVDVVICPPYAYLQQVTSLCQGTNLRAGGQDCSHMQEGAYTGEVAAPMLADLGCDWVIIGHSERRQYHQESSSLLAAKMAVSVEAGLTPIFCVGETRQEREAGEAEMVVLGQLRDVLADLPSIPGLVIAYEPVWAIGTGLTATADEAQEMHAFIRTKLQSITGSGERTRIVYGGSVKATNAAALFACEDIDGALVGGASLHADDFATIVSAAAAA
ncbi:triosephosphate isomerase [Chromatocurvus halotolerans]|uniref:Triosephosphate isomerase n=2 Tax=Chromatocurvus halotolerans TaxID=1132028 RepID=A0A4R2KQW9_9GAMM|nr:triosephosphate isomerase [Chromatocurvus halotolerans]